MSKTYESLEPQGHFNFAKRVFQKIKGYIDSKVQTNVPANAVFTDTTYTATGNIDISQQNVISRKEVWLNSMSDYNALSSVDPDTDYHVKGAFAITFSANKVIITDNNGNLIASNVTTEKLNQASDLTEAYRVVNGELYVVYDDGL